MNDKKLLILMGLLFVYVFYVNPINEENDLLKNKVSLLKRTLSKERSFLQKQPKLKDELSTVLDELKQKNNLFYTLSSPSGVNLSDVQTAVKKAAKNSSCSYKSGKWGEVENMDHYSRLPLRISIECGADEMVTFLNSIFKHDKLILFDTLRITKNSQSGLLRLSASLQAFKHYEAVSS